MYGNIFTYSFFLNFLLSSIFIIVNIFFSIRISHNESIKKKIFFNEFQPIIIFYLIFAIYTIIFNLTLLVDYNFLSEIFFLIVFFQLIFLIHSFKLKIPFYRLKTLFKDKIVLILFISFFLISILPISDADSIAYISYLPSKIFLEGLKDINLYKNQEFTLLSNTEIILIISSILKSDNFGSQLNLSALLFFMIINFKNHKNFFLIVLSSPLIIYFISAQKLQLFFAILFLISFILLNQNFLKRKSELFIFIFLLTFYSSGKISYLLFTLPLFLYFFYENLKKWKSIIPYSIVCFLIIYLPLFILKQNYFGNILAPFFDSFIGQNLESYKAQAISLRASEGWISNPTDISLYLRPFISFEISTLSSSLGIIFLLMLINYKTQKKTKYFPLILIGLVLLTGQILPRYYFEAFLILAYFYNPKKFLIKLFIYSQVSIIFLISVVFIYFAYFKYNVILDRDKYMNRFSYSFYNSNQHKKDNLKGNILDFSLDRQSIFFKNNIYSYRYLGMLNYYNNDYEGNLKKYISENKIDYLITNEDNFPIPNCIKTNEIKKTQRIKALRNFLVNPKIEYYKLLEIKENTCNIR